jgi:hypothetical protein
MLANIENSYDIWALSWGIPNTLMLTFFSKSIDKLKQLISCHNILMFMKDLLWNLPCSLCTSIRKVLKSKKWIVDKRRNYLRVIHIVILSSPCLWASFHALSPPQWYLQSKEILLNFSMKCWNLAFNAQGSRLIIVVVQLGAVKIYVATLEALRKKERQDETQFTIKIDAFLSLIPPCVFLYLRITLMYALVKFGMHKLVLPHVTQHI